MRESARRANDSGFDREFEAAISRPKAAAHRKVTSRRPSPVQGRALEILGHAIDYLVDTHVAQCGASPKGVEREAIELLSCASRTIYGECRVVLPLWTRLRSRMKGDLAQNAPVSVGENSCA